MLVVLACLLFINTRPDSFHVERSTTIAAPSESVFAKINDFHEWTAWSPWEKLDPALKRTFDGAAAGVGAGYHWVGNDKVGEGHMTIMESEPPRGIKIKLEFLKPFQATNTATFALIPDGPGTRVTWSMDGKNNFMAKAMSVFMNMDKMIGPDFERGLATLKSQAEAGAPATGGAPADSAGGASTR
jgi:uncharacterized protein YndB with AHSA1/START domain